MFHSFLIRSAYRTSSGFEACFRFYPFPNKNRSAKTFPTKEKDPSRGMDSPEALPLNQIIVTISIRSSKGLLSRFGGDITIFSKRPYSFVI